MTTNTALITGGSAGLGRALVHALVARGWHVITDARDAERLSAAVADLPAGSVTALPGDVTDAGHRAELVAAAERLGGLDLLVNNASTLGPSPLPGLAAFPLDALRQVVEVNVIAPLALTQLALPRLLASGHGTLVDVTSDAGLIAPRNGIPVGAT